MDVGSLPRGCNSTSYCVCFYGRVAWNPPDKSSRYGRKNINPESQILPDTHLASLWKESSRFSRTERIGENVPLTCTHIGPLSCFHRQLTDGQIKEIKAREKSEIRGGEKSEIKGREKSERIPKIKAK